MKRGITLVEVIIATFISLLILAAIYIFYTSIYKNFRREESISASQTESILNTDIIRYEIQEAGYGIGSNCSCNCTGFICDGSCLPIDFDKVKKGLVIRSTYNLTNEKTQGWALVDCSSGSFDIKAGSLPSGTLGFVILNASTRKIVEGFASSKTCPSAGIFLLFPYDPNISGSCSNQYCNLIEYYLGNSSTAPSYCAPGTKTLFRKVGKKAYPILYCVADFQVRFNWAGSLVNPESLSKVSFSNEVNKLQGVNVYILVQEGKRDNNFYFSENTTIDGVDLSLSGVKDYVHYRWKIIKISQEPMNLGR
ncbi:hypothetical protein [Thermovibrio sp.]